MSGATVAQRDYLADGAAIALTCVAFAGSFFTVHAAVMGWGVKGWMAYAIASMPEVTFLIGLKRVFAGTATWFVWLALISAGSFTMIGNVAEHANHVVSWRPWAVYMVAVWPAYSVILALGLSTLHRPRPPEAAPAEAVTVEVKAEATRPRPPRPRPLEAEAARPRPLEAEAAPRPLEASKAAPIEAAPRPLVIVQAKATRPRPPEAEAAPAEATPAEAARLTPAEAARLTPAEVKVLWEASEGAMKDLEIAGLLGVSKDAARSRRRNWEGTKG